MESPVKNSYSVVAVFPPTTGTYRLPRMVFSLSESKKGMTGMLVSKGDNTERSEKASFITTKIFGLSFPLTVWAVSPFIISLSIFSSMTLTWSKL